MTTVGGSPHPEFLGAYVMGLVDDDERAQIDAHVAGCPACRDEIAQLSGLRGVLDAVPRAAVLDDLAALDAADTGSGPDGTDDLLLRRTLKGMRDESRRSRRLRLLGAAASVVAVAGLAGVAGVVIGQSEEAANPPAVAQQPVRTMTTTDPVTGVGMTARITPAGAYPTAWSRLNVSVSGVAPGTTCQIVVVARDGQRDVAGSWVVGTPRPGVPRRGVDGSTAIEPDDVASVQIVDGSGKRLVGANA
jgi:hypothetical protein